MRPVKAQRTLRGVLHFNLGRIPVTVELMFWLTAVLLGMNYQPIIIAVWVAVVFVSVLIHELGHAAVALALGGRPEIRLRAFGGVTFPGLRKRPSIPQEIALSLAGPLAGAALGGIAWLIVPHLELSQSSLGGVAVLFIFETSFYWAILNLLPILPLDGGHVMQSVITAIRGKPSLRQAAMVSIATGAAAALAAYFIYGQTFVALFIGLFALQNFSLLSQARPEREAAPEPQGPSSAERADVDRYTETARRAMAAGDDSGALAAAELLESGEGAWRQSAGLRIRAGVLLAAGRLPEAARLAGQSFAMAPTADAAVVASRANLRLGDREAAASWLRRAVEAGAPADAVRADRELSELVQG